MASQLKPITLWGAEGPNPPKVSILLEELGVPYEVNPVTLGEVKSPEYLAVNPNGRIPSIQDPNTGITLWESGAIFEYLIETYDKDQRLSFSPGTHDSFHAKQWLFFQVSGQGPYYGQAAWFAKFHPEKIPSAIERYTKEINRVTGVLNGHLAKQKEKYAGSSNNDGPWLVGNRICYADLTFVTYQRIASVMFAGKGYDVDDYPHVKDWLDRMDSRKPVKTIMDKLSAARAAHVKE